MTDSFEYQRRDLSRGIDHIGIAACFVVHDGSGKFVLYKRSQNCRDEQGTWDNGGGAVEFNENIEDAVKREVGEELSAEALDTIFLGWYEVKRTLNGKPTHWMPLLTQSRLTRNRLKTVIHSRLMTLAGLQCKIYHLRFAPKLCEILKLPN